MMHDPLLADNRDKDKGRDGNKHRLIIRIHVYMHAHTYMCTLSADGAGTDQFPATS